jgi:hypothetical protein
MYGIKCAQIPKTTGEILHKMIEISSTGHKLNEF